MREFARVYHDGNMAKFLDTELGKIFLQPRTMRKSAAEEYELLAKRGGVPHVRYDQPAGGQPTYNERQPNSAVSAAADSDDDRYEEYGTKIARLMKERGMNFDEAATAAMRGNVNFGGRREMAGNHTNE